MDCLLTGRIVTARVHEPLASIAPMPSEAVTQLYQSATSRRIGLMLLLASGRAQVEEFQNRCVASYGPLLMRHKVNRVGTQWLYPCR